MLMVDLTISKYNDRQPPGRQRDAPAVAERCASHAATATWCSASAV
jgi:hypothetical protein